MRLLILLCVCLTLVAYKCDDETDPQTATVVPDSTSGGNAALDSTSLIFTSPQKISNEDAWDMIREYRYSNGVKLKKGNTPGEKRSNISVRFDAALLQQATSIPGATFYIITAAYVKDPAEPKYNVATKLLKLVIPKKDLVADTSYYLPVNESLCPPPDDCTN
jgi:hypothetical protein